MSDKFMVTMSDVESKPYKPTKHTLEGWRVKTKKERNLDDFGMPVAQTIGGNYFIGNLMDWGAFDEKANADRIVACVNACAGINPDAVPDVVAALRACERELMQMRIEDAARWTPDYKKQLEHAESGLTIIKARAALAKLEQ